MIALSICLPPYRESKWYLITSLDDYHRLILYAVLVERESLKISINNLELKVPKAPLQERIQLRIIPDQETGISEVRFWHEDEFLGNQKVKNTDLNLVQF